MAIFQWDKRGEAKKSGTTPFAPCLLMTKGTSSSASLFSAQFVKSPLSNAILSGRPHDDAQDHPFANEMTLTFFKSQHTGRYIKKPLKLSLVCEGKGEGETLAEVVWELTDIVESAQTLFDLDLFSTGGSHTMHAHIHASLEGVSDSSQPSLGKTGRSMSISNLNLSLRRMSRSSPAEDMMKERKSGNGSAREKEEEESHSEKGKVEEEPKKETASKSSPAGPSGIGITVTKMTNLSDRVRELEQIVKEKDEEIERLRKELRKYQKERE